MSSKQRNIRKRRAVDDSEESDEYTKTPILNSEDIKLLQKQRQRRAVCVCGSGCRSNSFHSPFLYTHRGLIFLLQGLDATQLAAPTTGETLELQTALNDDSIKQSFRKEVAQVTVEDKQMALFVETELAKRLGTNAEAVVDKKSPVDILHEGIQTRKVTEEVMPWVSGISEVALSLQHKLANIEETEAAKQRLLVNDDTYDHNKKKEQREYARSLFPRSFGMKPKR